MNLPFPITPMSCPSSRFDPSSLLTFVCVVFEELGTTEPEYTNNHVYMETDVQ